MYFIASGCVAVVTGPPEQHAEVTRLREGAFFGEMALLSSEKRSADVLAMTPCHLAVLGRDDYLEVVQEKQNSKMALKQYVLEANPYFRCLTAAQRGSIARSGKLQRFSAGDTIIAQDSAPAEEIYLILRGSSTSRASS